MKFVLIAAFIALLAATVVIGYHKGFLCTLVSMGAVLISIILVVLFSGKVTELLNKNTDLRQKIQQSVYEKLTEDDSDTAALTDEEQKQSAKDSFVPDVILNAFNDRSNPFGSQNDYYTDLSGYIADLAMKACGVLITLLGSFIVIRVVIALCGLMNKVPILGTVNRVLGAALGLAFGLVVIWVFCFAVTTFASTGFGQTCLEAIKDSKLLSLFYNGALSFQGVAGLL